MSAPTGSAPAGSIATASFAHALDEVRSWRPVLSGAALPLRFAVAPSTAVGDPAGDPLGAGAEAGPLHAAALALRDGRTTARRLAEEALAAIDQRDGELHAVVAIDRRAVLAAADAADAAAAQGRWAGPLHGLCLTVKDVIDVAGLPTRGGSDAYEAHPVVDAAAVARLRAAGAVVLAKVSTHEFALGVTSPQSRNPHDAGRIPGGSSGGSAVAVATGMGLGSVGTDTRASIRVPAALSGVVGFKPTLGGVPTDGVVTLSWTMDHVGLMGRSVADAALLLGVAEGRGRALAATPPSVRWRIGVPAATFDDAEPGVAAAVDAALVALEAAGATRVDVDRPDHRDLAAANAAGLVVSRCEAATSHRALGLDRSRYWQEVGEQLDAADDVLATDYLDAQRIRGALAARLARAFDEVDVLAMPTSPVVAPRIDDFARYLMLLARNAIPWSFIGYPVVSVPCGLSEGLPVGLQLVAPPWREDVLVAVGRALEVAIA